jgi:hypothetical protein
MARAMNRKIRVANRQYSATLTARNGLAPPNRMRLRVVGDSDSALDAWFACVGEQLFGLAIHHATG